MKRFRRLCSGSGDQANRRASLEGVCEAITQLADIGLIDIVDAQKHMFGQPLV
jgi:hypothetical protein